MNTKKKESHEEPSERVPMYVTIDPQVKQLVENRAKLERRSLASMVEILLRQSIEVKSVQG